MRRLIPFILFLVFLVCVSCSKTAETDTHPVPLNNVEEEQQTVSNVQEPNQTKGADGEDNALPQLRLETIEDILSADLWAYEEDMLFASMTSSGWEAFSVAGAAGNGYLKQLDGLPVALSFDCFDSGKIKALSLQTLVRTEETRAQAEESLQDVEASVWSNARMVLFTDDEDYAALASEWILNMREKIRSVGGTLTEGAMRFSGNTADEISDVINDFFRGEETPSSVVIGEGYFELPDGSHVQTTAVVNQAAVANQERKSLDFLVIRRHADWVNVFGIQPQPSVTDYRPNNLDGYFSVNFG